MEQPDLNRIWNEAAAAIGLAAVRAGDAGAATGTDAGCVLYEICRVFVAGVGAQRETDAPADPARGAASDDHAVAEAAAVRLQAHLLGGYGLRALLPPAAGGDLFRVLPGDAFLPEGDESARLARAAAARIARPPTGGIVRRALAASRQLVDPARHGRSGHPLDRDGRCCGDCTWRTAGGLCRQAPRRAFVRPEEVACTRWEAPFECARCGACCRSAFDRVPVRPRERVARRRPSLLVADGGQLGIARAGDRCVALDGPPGGPYRCAIYDDRPRTCRDFGKDGANCLEARRRVGL